jgi:hypothetical protein
VPIAGATITTITLLIDTIRLYFVTQKLTLESAVDFVGEQAATGGTWATHKVTAKEEELKRILDAPPSNVLLVVGPKGTDKSSLFKKLLSRRMFSVRIDCSQVDTVQEFMDLVVHDIGFRPSFTTINTLLSWFSSIVPGAGQASVESQFRSVLRALERTYLLARSPPVIAFDEIEHFLRLLDVCYPAVFSPSQPTHNSLAVRKQRRSPQGHRHSQAVVQLVRSSRAIRNCAHRLYLEQYLLRSCSPKMYAQLTLRLLSML